MESAEREGAMPSAEREEEMPSAEREEQMPSAELEAQEAEQVRERRRLGTGLCTLAPVVLLLAWWIAPLATGSRTLYLRDVLNTHLPMKAAHAALLRSGEWLPLVDPQRAGGQPLLGNPNAVPLYPDNVLYLVAPTLWALNAHFWLHLLGALVAAYCLARAFGLARQSSVAAAVVYGACGFTLSNLNFYNLIAGVALAPALTAAAIHSRLRPGRLRPIAALGGSWALLLLGGEPLQAAFALILATLAWFLIKPRALAGSSVLQPVLGLSLGTLAAAPQLVELIRILPASLRGFRGYGADGGTIGSLDLRQALDWILPFATGRPDLLRSGALWGDAFYAGKPPIFFSLYAGTLAFALVLVSGTAWRRRTAEAPAEAPSEPTAGVVIRRWAWCAVALAIGLAFGGANPLVRPLFTAGLLRYPVKSLLLAAPALALLAGLGWERAVCGGARRSLARALVALAAFCGVAWLALTVAPRAGEALLRSLVPARFDDVFVAGERLRWAGTCFLTLVVAVLLVAVERTTRSERRAWATGLLLGVHACGQFLLLRPLVATEPASAYAPSALVASLPSGARIVHGEVSNLFGPPALAAEPLERPELRFVERRAFAWLYPPSGVPAGLRYELNTAPDGLDAYVTRVAQATVERLPDASRVWLLRSWAVEHLLLGRPLDSEAAALVDPPRRIDVEGGALYDYAFRDPLPAAHFAGTVVPAPDINVALGILLRPDFDPRATVVIAGEGASEPGGAGSVTVIAEATERIELEVTAETPGVVVFERVPLPIYRATVDGSPAEVEIANLQRSGVRVPAGRHRVVLATDRRPTRLAAAGAGLGWLALLGLGSVGFHRRRSEAR